MPDPKTFLSDTNIVELKHRLLYIQRKKKSKINAKKKKKLKFFLITIE